ncbi:hypothetical protein FGK63_08550 [Ruegeria sediminis]|uniref:Nuclear transport factor 2 family protein n=1 Tax=Ruegeria sediminis TaxID=2583820 RepID=A0ABY2X1M7_9RHOB|nr:hypothetical protein [Ruegeria sediminis]TMV09146.1 hypothetical protein FGK63_08550 [Ruegeria sediminis]
MTVGKAPASARKNSVRKQGGKNVKDNAILWDLEARFWTSGADSARTMTSENAVMILPYPPGILRGNLIWKHVKQNAVWRTVEMKDRSETSHGVVAVLAYLAIAEKPGSPIYKALCASTYLLDDGGWLRLSHQQTPTA